MRDADVFALAFPAEFGGTGTGTLVHLRAVEELSWADASVGLILAVQGLGGLPVLLAGTEQQKQAYLPRFASGEWLAAYALTEPGAGSDAQAIATTARRDGDHWVIDGTKRFITNAGVATVYTACSCPDRRRHLGVSRPRRRSRLRSGEDRAQDGHQGSTTGELHFDFLPDPGDRLVGERAQASGWRCGCSIGRGPGSPPKLWGSPRRHSTTPAGMPPSGWRSASRSQSSRASSSCWPIWPPRSRAGAACSIGWGDARSG